MAVATMDAGHAVRKLDCRVQGILTRTMMTMAHQAVGSAEKKMARLLEVCAPVVAAGAEP